MGEGGREKERAQPSLSSKDRKWCPDHFVVSCAVPDHRIFLHASSIPDTTKSRSILRQSVLDRVWLCSAHPSPETASSNLSSYRRLFPSTIRQSPLNQNIWNIGTSWNCDLSIDRAEKNQCFASAVCLGANHNPTSFTILKASSKPRKIPNLDPQFTPFPRPISSHIHLFTHYQEHHNATRYN